jgi:hypothetical protein
MSVSLLPIFIAAAGVIALAFLVLSFLSALRKRRLRFWTFTACFVASLLTGYGAFTRLERIHGELFRGDTRAKSKADLLARFGAPTRTRSYVYEGRTIECWIYEIKLLEPHIFTQFEMFNGEITATVSTTHI